MKLGIIYGTVEIETKEGEKDYVNTKYGSVEVTVKKINQKEIMFIDRHQSRKILANNINYNANMLALKQLGVENIIAINSCGSLKKNIKPSTIVIPDDYFCPWKCQTIFEDVGKYMVPEIDKELRDKIIKTAKKSGIKVMEKGIYAETFGPRYETKAETKFLSQFADVVGMTMASEATIAKELNIKYASICSVDNYANGIGPKISQEEIEKNAKTNSVKIKKLLDAIIKEI